MAAKPPRLDAPPWQRFRPAAPSRVELSGPEPPLITAAQGWLEPLLLDVTAGTLASMALSAESAGSQRPGFVFVLVEGEPIGVARSVISGSTLVIDLLAVAPARRNLGYGCEAVSAIEEAARGVELSQALVPLTNGLAVYFWLRAGYRPVFAAEHGRGPVTVMQRRLSGPGEPPAV